MPVPQIAMLCGYSTSLCVGSFQAYSISNLQTLYKTCKVSIGRQESCTRKWPGNCVALLISQIIGNMPPLVSPHVCSPAEETLTYKPEPSTSQDHSHFEIFISSSLCSIEGT